MITASETKKRSSFSCFHPAPAAPRPTCTRSLAEDPFLARFGHKLPAGLRNEAYAMQWRTFTATYAPATDLHLHFTDITKLRGSRLRFTATITSSSGRSRTAQTTEIIASGAASAATQLLANAGRRVEILSFHQFEVFEATVTFILAADNEHKHWAMGFGSTREQSIATALSNAAYILHG